MELIKVAERPTFDCHIELHDDVPFIHTTVHEWSKKTMSEMQIVFDLIVGKCEELGFDNVSFYGTENEVKLAKSFAPLDELDKIDDINYVGTWYI